MKEFTVDKYQKDKIIKERVKDIKGSDRLEYVSCNLLILIAVIALVAGIILICRDRVSYMTTLMLLIQFALCSGFFICSASILRVQIEDKYLYPISHFVEDSLYIIDDGFLYCKHDTNSVNELTTFKVLFKDIKNVEYDSRKHCIKVHAKIKVSNQLDGDGNIDVNTNMSDDELRYEQDMLIPAYFSDFDEFISELRQKTDAQITMCEIKLQEVGS